MELPRGLGKVPCAVLCLGLAALGCSRSSRHSSPITINEVMAGGASRPLLAPDGTPVVDAMGNPADWVEIYNPLSHPVNLASYTLSDDPRDPRKYRFPPLVLQPGEFVVVILDGNPAAGPLHAGFRLSGRGEEVLLFGRGGRALVDRKVFRELEPDATAGRYPDGAADYGVIYAPTPGRPNKRIGIKPPRFDGAPEVTPEADPGTPGLVPVRVTILEDLGVVVTNVLVERAASDSCNLPFKEDPQRPERSQAVEVFRQSAPDEFRRDVSGVLRPHPQERLIYFTLIPREPDGTILRLRTTAENEIGPAVHFGCHCFCLKASLVINEFQASNLNTILFDQRSADGRITERTSPDWIELLNFGDQPVDLSEFALIGAGTYQDLQDPAPPNPPELYLWRFGDVGITTIEPGQHLLVLADGDNPFDAQGRPAFRTYALSLGGQGDFRYRSTSFQISDGRPNNPSEGDGFYLLDPRGFVVDQAEYNFSDQPGGEIAPDLSFGRFPDADQAGTGLSHSSGGDRGGRILECPTPGEANQLECGDVAPRFEEVVYTEPRCPGPGNRTIVTAFVGIDQDTVAADRAGALSFEVQFTFSAGSQSVTLERQAGLGECSSAAPLSGLVVCRPTRAQIDNFRPRPVGFPGAELLMVQAVVPGQPAGTLVTYSLRARDLRLAADPETPARGDWVDHSEATAPLVSFRFKPGYQRPMVFINEVFPSSSPQGPLLRYRGEAEPRLAPIDYVELYNSSGAEVDLSGMFLHDEELPGRGDPQGRLREFKLPAGTVMAPHGFFCLFFPRPGEEALVPPDAVTVGGMGLEDCSEVLYLLAPDEDGNCVVADAQWDIRPSPPPGPPPPEPPPCPAGAAVGLRPDANVGSRLVNLDRLPVESPCASNCGGRSPELSQTPFHFTLTSANTPMACVEPNDIVLVRAAVLIDAFAAVLHPNPSQGAPTGIREARLVVRRGAVETESNLTLAPLPNPPPPDECWVQVRLDGQIRGPHPAVTFYKIRIEDGNGNTLQSEEFSFGLAGTKPPLAINEVMAVNTRTLADDRGQFVPWIELYNGGSEAADFGGMFLTDDALQPRKWEFPRTPATVVPAKGFLVVFADGDTRNPDDLHVSFTIRASGPGDLFLLDKLENGTCIIDSFHYDFTGLDPDTSIGRVPDGTGEPVVLPVPSPGGPNSGGQFIRGELTQNGRVNVSDLAWFYQVLFDRAPEPACLDALDVNDDGQVDTQDGIHLGSFLFLHGPTIPPPFPLRGVDPTLDDLPCL